MEDGIENCHERSLQAANVLLLFGPIENPRWLPVGILDKVQSEAFMAPGSHVG
jgi:hypothetical protein